jgi:hypothetical protein
MGADLDFYDDEVDVEDVEAAKDGGIDDESAKPYPDHHRLHPNCCKPSQLLLLLLTQHKWLAAWALKWALDGRKGYPPFPVMSHHKNEMVEIG